MRKILVAFKLVLLIVVFVSCESTTENKVNPKNPYNLDLISDISVYNTSVSQNPDNELVDLEKYIPGIKLDIRYATTNNFTNQVVYPKAKAFARKSVAKALKTIENSLKDKGLGLVIFDAYRPYSITVKFYEIFPDSNFVASPKTGSRHNRGCAIDLSVINLQSGKEIKMPTGYDDFTDKAHPEYPDIPEEALANRTMLINIMKDNGFTVFPTEWWHFDFIGWQNYKLMDISFDDLAK